VSTDKIEIRRIRRSGLIGATILFAIGSLHLWKGHTGAYMMVPYTLSAIIFIMAGFFTSAFKNLTHAIGDGITKLLLAIIFYLVFTPAGLIIRLLGKDPLRRSIDKDRDSYWEKKPPSVGGHEKQF